ncbi:MAG: hypothetical protein AAGD22_07510 [Verrucomicrobiota bacterium]
MEEEASEDEAEKNEDPGDLGGLIECKVTPWYFRRMGLMTLMVVGMATYFLYDGSIGYPKKNRKADLYDAFLAAQEAADVGSGPAVGDGGGDAPKTWEEVVEVLDLEVDDAEGAGHITNVKEAYEAGAGGETWKAFSLERKLPEKPERMTQKEIEEQFHFAWGLYAVGGIIIAITLLNARKMVSADDEAYVTAKGKRVPFDTIYRIDKRKWDNKGLAYAYYKEGADRKQKAVIDDLKFDGAGKILDRMLMGFDGELVERVYIDDDEDDAEADGDGGEPGRDEGSEEITEDIVKRGDRGREEP